MTGCTEFFRHRRSAHHGAEFHRNGRGDPSCWATRAASTPQTDATAKTGYATYYHEFFAAGRSQRHHGTSRAQEPHGEQRGTWKPAQSLSVNQGVTWKQAQSVWVNSGRRVETSTLDDENLPNFL